MLGYLPRELLVELCKFAKEYSYLIPIEVDEKASFENFFYKVCKCGDIKNIQEHIDKIEFECDNYFDENYDHHAKIYKYITALYDTNDLTCIEIANNIHQMYHKYYEGGPMFISGKCKVENYPQIYNYSNNILRRAVKYENIRAIEVNKLYREKSSLYTYCRRYKKTNIIEHFSLPKQRLAIECIKIYNKKIFEAVIKKFSEYELQDLRRKIPEDCLDILLKLDDTTAINILLNKFNENFNLLCKYLEIKQNLKVKQCYIRCELSIKQSQKLINTNVWCNIEMILYKMRNFRMVRLQSSFTELDTEKFLRCSSNLDREFLREDWSNLIIKPEYLTQFDKNITCKLWNYVTPEIKNSLTSEQFCKIIDTLV